MFRMHNLNLRHTGSAIFLSCLCAVSVFAGTAEELLEEAGKLLGKGNCIEALEAYSRAAGMDPSSLIALQGIQAAKNELRQQMGEVSATKLSKMLARLDAIDASRVSDLNDQLAALQAERETAFARIAILEKDLAVTSHAVVSSPKATPKGIDAGEIRQELVVAQGAAKTAKDKVAELTREIESIQKENLLARKSAEKRIQSLIAKNELTGTEKKQMEQSVAKLAAENKDLGVKVSQFSAENKTLETEKAQLLAKVDDLSKPVPAVAKPAYEVVVLQAENKDLKNRNSELAAELAGVKATVDKQPTVATVAPIPAPVFPPVAAASDASTQKDIAALKSQMGKMEKDLLAAEQEKEQLVGKMTQLTKDLRAKQIPIPDKRLTGIERKAISQSMGIKLLATSVAQSQESCDALLATLAESAFEADKEVASSAKISSKLTVLKERLEGLKGDLPSAVVVSAVEMPVAEVSPDNNKLEKALNKLVSDTSQFDANVMAATVSAGTLKQGLAVDSAEVEKRLREMDAMHEKAGKSIERLKRQLRKTEALIEDAG